MSRLLFIFIVCLVFACGGKTLDLTGKTISVAFKVSEKLPDYKHKDMLVDMPERFRRAIYREVYRGLTKDTKFVVAKVEGQHYLNFEVWTQTAIATGARDKIEGAIRKGIGQSGGEVLFVVPKAL